MNAALWVSKTGLDAQQTNIATISNNLANASTIGYKKGRAIFEDLFYQNVNQPGGRSSENTELPSGLMLGTGSKVVATQKMFTDGNVQSTDNSLDMMIEGSGFFQILMPDGTMAYTRNGQFTRSAEGQIVTNGEGYVLQPEIVIPENATSVTIGEDGTVSVRVQGQNQSQNIGQITTVDFINPGGLEPIGKNLYTITGASGDAIEGVPGIAGLGRVRQAALETSNVNVTEELVNLIEAQRVYEMNSKVISSVDEMLGFASQQL